MLFDAAQTEHLSQVISHALAPAFLLGAISGIVAVLINRVNGVIERMRTLNAIPVDDAARAHLKADLPRLRRRARLLNAATLLAVSSAICTTFLVIVAFISAFIGVRHEPVAALIFLVAMSLMCGALATLAAELRIALSDYDHFS